MSEIPDESIPVIDPIRSQDSQKPSMAGDVVRLASGTMFAQLIGVIVSPILARIFTPSDYGNYQVFNSIFYILVILISLRYESAIVLPRDDSDAINLLALSSLLSLIFAAISVPFFVLFGKWLTIMLGSPELYPFLWAISVNLLLMGLYNAANYWNTRTRKFGRLAFARFNNSTGSSLAQLAAGWIGWVNVGGLIGGTLIGSFLSTVILVGQIWFDDAREFSTKVNWQSIWGVAVRYKKFPLFSTWAGLLNSISVQMPALMLSSFFSPEATGYYSLGNRILRLPAQLIGAAIAQVLYQRASEAAKEGKLSQIVEQSFRRVITLGMFPFLILSIAGKELFIVAFGQNWAEAGIYSQILSIWTFFTFIGSPLTTINLVLERQEVSLYFNIALFVTRLGSLLIGGHYHDPRLALFLYAISGIVLWTWYTFWITSSSGIPIARTLKQLGSYLLICSPGVLTLSILKWIIQSQTNVIFFVSVSLVIIYYLIIYFTDKDIRSFVLTTVKNRNTSK